MLKRYRLAGRTICYGSDVARIESSFEAELDIARKDVETAYEDVELLRQEVARLVADLAEALALLRDYTGMRGMAVTAFLAKHQPSVEGGA